MKNAGFLRRFGCAASGIIGAFQREASFRTQVLAGVAAAVLFSWLRPPLIWIALCTLAAGGVLALELINTSLEHLADRLHPEVHESIRRAKDCAAGAVLVASWVAALIGLMTVAISLGWLGR